MVGQTHDGRTASQEAHVANFCASIDELPRDMEDCAADQEELETETLACTLEHRQAMATAVSAHMWSGAPTSVNTNTQQHLHIFTYLTATAWAILQSKGYPWDVKVEYVVDFCLVIGLRYPSDDTIRCIIAILPICHERALSPQEAYDAVHDFRMKVVSKRPCNTGARTMTVFPKDPSEFRRLYRGVYLDHEPPVGKII